MPSFAADDRQWVYAGADGYAGIQGFFEEVESYRYKLHVRVFLSRYRTQSRCPRCAGTRLKAEALSVKVGGATIADLCNHTIEDLAAFVENLRLGAARRWWRATSSACFAPSCPSSRAWVSATSRSRARRGRSRG